MRCTSAGVSGIDSAHSAHPPMTMPFAFALCATGRAGGSTSGLARARRAANRQQQSAASVLLQEPAVPPNGERGILPEQHA
jgi:hypothetical protein